MPTLSNWLNKNKVQYVQSVSDWKEAIQIAGRPLLDEGAISPAYIDYQTERRDRPLFRDCSAHRDAAYATRAGRNGAGALYRQTGPGG